MTGRISFLIAAAVAAGLLLLMLGVDLALSRWPQSFAALSEYEKGEASDSQESEIENPDYLRLRDEYIGLRRGVDPDRGLHDPRARERAVQEMELRETWAKSEARLAAGAMAPFAGGSWTPLGPAPLPNGISSFGAPVSGRAVAIAVHPTDPRIVYLGAAQGGVWRSLNGGQTWDSIFDTAESLAIGAIAIAPSNPSIVYVGTGEPSQSGDSFFGVGLYRIENADGASPVLIGPINPSVTSGSAGGARTYNAFTGRSISKILVHPADPATIFVSTATGIGGRGTALTSSAPPLGLRGVFRSNNATAAPASVTFTKLTVTTGNSFDSPGTGNSSVIDMVMEPGNPNTIIAAVIGLSDPFGGIYRSTNALTTATFNQQLVLPVGIRTELAINKVGSDVTVYAATGETPAVSGTCGTARGAVRKSIDGGITWSNQMPGGQGFCGAQCGYDIAVAVHPNNTNLVYLGGQARGTCSDSMKKSTDGGATFVRDDASSIHPDSHALAFDTSGNIIYTTNDGGVWKANVPSAGPTAWIDLNLAPLNTLQFVGLAVHPFDRHIVLGGTQDNGTELQQGSGGNWLNVRGGDGGYALIDQGAQDSTNVTMYHTFFFRGGSTSPQQIGYGRTLSIGGTWANVGCFNGVPANGINCTDNVLFYAPMALGPGTPNTVYLGTDRLYRSSDRGITHTIVSQQPISGGSPISSVAISPQDDNYRIVGLANGEIWASTGSTTFVNISSAAFPANPASTTSKFVGRVMFDPNNKEVAYVAFAYFASAGQLVWKITNLSAAVAAPASANWTAAANGIPSIPVTAFAVDPANSNNLFAGTDIGVFNSSDGGTSWAPFGTGLPRVAVFDMAVQNANRILRVGTHGRGVWEISIAASSPTPTPTPIPTPTPTPPPTPSPSSVTILVEQGTNTLAALDSVTFARGPFALANSNNFSSDQRTRIIFYTTNLGFSQVSQPHINTLSVQVDGIPYAVESVGPDATTSGSFIVFRLPDLSPNKTYSLGLRLNNVNSTNTPDLTIVASQSGSAAAGSSTNLVKYLLLPIIDLLL